MAPEILKAFIQGAVDHTDRRFMLTARFLPFDDFMIAANASDGPLHQLRATLYRFYAAPLTSSAVSRTTGDTVQSAHLAPLLITG